MTNRIRYAWSFAAGLAIGAVVHHLVTRTYPMGWMLFEGAVIGYGLWYAIYGYGWRGWKGKR